MAETAVSPLIDRLISFLTEEKKLLGGIHGGVTDIKDELESIQSFLKDADARVAAEGDSSEGVKTWVKQVRAVAFRIDVAIDEYLLHMAQHPRRHGYFGFLHKIALLLKTLKPRHKIAAEIEEIKASVQKIKERSERYRFQTAVQGSSSSAQNVSPSLGDGDVVGIEAPRKKLIGLLVEGQTCRTVLSVVGMGGLGKTTLAKKVYDDQTVKDHFDCHAWIPVSQSYNVEDLLRSMIEEFCKEREELPPEEMDSRDKIYIKATEYLQDKRYVVVFDDVWKIDFWGEIERALPDNGKGGRIMITTRNLEVANFCLSSSPVHVHALEQLPPDMALELFCKKAFHHDFRPRPSKLEKSSLDIVQKCNGSPLAILAIGGLLATKKKSIEWDNLLGNLGGELEKNLHLKGVKNILSLSYEDLPYNLKSCFLYLGMYPNGCSINCVSLIRQWIAEGFVEEIDNKTSEEVARQYLNELINRSLVQVVEFNFDGKVRRCQLHDLFHEMVLQKMKDLSFCHVLSKEKSRFKELTRRLSTGGVSYDVLEGFKDKHIHSILLFNVDELPKSFMKTFFASFKLLRVMDFEDAPLSHIPKDVGSLFHLRYLSLRNTEVEKLPKSIGKLQNLETLDLKGSLVSNIPVEINKLRKLRHLIAYRNNKRNVYLAWENGIKIQKGIGCLEDLQKLCHVEVNHGGVELIKELGKLRQLRKLGVKKLTEETMKALCASIEKMNHLESLHVASIHEYVIIDLQSISSPPQCLQRLYIKGYLEKLPVWIPNLQHLVRIQIFWSNLRHDPLETFQNLPNLLQLTMSKNAYMGDQLHFKKGGFPKLKNLRLNDMNRLYSLIIDEGALPLLECLLIGRIPQLKEMPSGIQHLRNLRELSFTEMAEDFKASVYPKQEWIVERIPVVNFLNEKQKVVIKLQMDSDKCRSKALKIAEMAAGVHYLAAGGSTLSVIGEGIDPISLVRSLREKVGYAEISSAGSQQIREVSITGKKPEEEEDNPTPSYCPDQGCK